jgi:hypothetical protein
MGIPVTCRNGHHFSVKDKYAGKKGLCPYCEGQVEVRVPDALSSQDFKKAYSQAYREERSKTAGRMPTSSDASVFDSPPDEGGASSSGSSLLGSSVVRHNIRCKCGESVPMWFAKCPKCGVFIEHF